MVRRKDEGYSWLVLASVSLSQLIYGTFTFGVLSVLTYIWIEKFSISTDTAAWASSILAAVLFLTGPLMAVILHSIGSWKTQLIGSLLSLASGLALAFSTEFWHVLIIYSICQAFGYAMTQIATIDIISDYFDRHKDKIYAALMTSFCVGFLVGPVMVETLLNTLGYQHTFLVMAAISALNLPSGFIYRGLPCCQRESAQNKSDNQTKELDTVSKRVESRSSLSHAEEEKFSTELGTTEAKLSVREKLLKIVKQHMKILKQPAFLLVLIHYILSMAGENSFYALCVDFFVRKEILTLTQAALGMTLCGISAVVGSTLLAVLSHWPLDRLLVTIVTTFLFGLGILFLPLCNDIVSSYAFIIVFGLNDSIFAANIMSFVTQQFGSGVEDGSSLIRLSYTFCCMGVGALVGPVLAGNLIPLAGLDGMFYIIGGFPILSSIILIPYWAVLKYRNRNVSHTA